DDSEVDGVIIATPQHWHALATIWACQAGKDVYIEKCISFNIPEGQKMIEATMKYERIVQCGTQNRSSEYALSARDYIKSGQLGEVVTVNVMELLNGPVPFNEKQSEKTPDTIDWNMWLGPAPEVAYSISRNKSWGYYWDYSGGYALANGSIHQMDLARIVLGDPGFPKSVYSTGGRYLFDDQRDMPDYLMTTFDYGNFVLTLQTGEFTPYMAKSSLEIRHGDGFPEWKQNSTKIVIYGTKRMMYVGRMGGGWQVFDKDGQIVAQESGLFPLKAHMGNFIDCIRSRNQPNGNIVEGHKSAVLMHLANLSYRAGKKQLYFSSESEMITNDQKARELAVGTYRKGFNIPKEV
ncbi:MAG: Gfo/Idh/MocA family oxidoreductase, partial [Cyclobacteriaceae bacterium]|nr:Gfo/Idh/MocA family oxidoreductase [Cyclobacteriaceae bacterium]